MFLTAPLIHNGHGFLPAGSAIEVDDDGLILAVHDNLTHEDVVKHDGVLCPGFINAHCHIELSHMQGMIPEHTGIIPFLQKVPGYRTQFTDEQVKAARHEAYNHMVQNGIVAVGDIANTADTLDVRQLDKLHIHTFVECIGFTETFARQRFEQSEIVYRQFEEQEQNDKLLRQSINPHAPYSVSKAVFDMIDKFQPHSLLTIHNQEGEAENEYYQQKTGAVRELLGGFGISDDFFNPSGKTSLQTYTEWLSYNHSCLFVHNTFTTKHDVALAVDRFVKTSWCLCPGANLYIEGRLADVMMFAEQGVNICVGTDSLASNHRLCIMSEIITLKKHFPELDWATLLRWATINGAKALDMEREIGTIEPGKKPGILNIVTEGLPEPKTQNAIDTTGKTSFRRII